MAGYTGIVQVAFLVFLVGPVLVAASVVADRVPSTGRRVPRALRKAKRATQLFVPHAQALLPSSSRVGKEKRVAFFSHSGLWLLSCVKSQLVDTELRMRICSLSSRGTLLKDLPSILEAKPKATPTITKKSKFRMHAGRESHSKVSSLSKASPVMRPSIVLQRRASTTFFLSATDIS